MSNRVTDGKKIFQKTLNIWDRSVKTQQDELLYLQITEDNLEA